MKEKIKTVDFGAPEKFGAHIYQVIIPEEKEELKKDVVKIVEHYGFAGGEGGLPYETVRAIISKKLWSCIADAVRLDFNDRLKSIKTTTSRWKSGINKVDRLLGKELCILAWAVEQASEMQIITICRKWSALRPEERWWLFSSAAAEGGLAESSQKGWRKAIYHALSGE
jgi:hypothetical protein